MSYQQHQPWPPRKPPQVERYERGLELRKQRLDEEDRAKSYRQPRRLDRVLRARARLLRLARAAAREELLARFAERLQELPQLTAPASVAQIIRELSGAWEEWERTQAAREEATRQAVVAYVRAELEGPDDDVSQAFRYDSSYVATYGDDFETLEAEAAGAPDATDDDE